MKTFQEFLNELIQRDYKAVGMMEMIAFKGEATPDERKRFEELKKHGETPAWDYMAKIGDNYNQFKKHATASEKEQYNNHKKTENHSARTELVNKVLERVN